MLISLAHFHGIANTINIVPNQNTVGIICSFIKIGNENILQSINVCFCNIFWCVCSYGWFQAH